MRGFLRSIAILAPYPRRIDHAGDLYPVRPREPRFFLDIRGVPRVCTAGHRHVAIYPRQLRTWNLGGAVRVERLSADFLFRHMGGRMLYGVRLNMALFYHRNVTPFDAIIARMAIEIVGNYGAAVFSYLLLYWIGAVEWPHDMPLLFLGYFYMTWWCVSVGFIVAAFSEHTPIFEKIWTPISYIYLAASGFPYMAAWLPGWLRPTMLNVMPSLPCYEMIRSGIFGPVMRFYYDIPRLSLTLGAISLVGLLGLRDVRRYIVNG